MAEAQKAWRVEYAKSGRSSCGICKDAIAKEMLRLGKMVQSTHFDGLVPVWHHVGCITKEANHIKALEDIEGIEALRWEDQQNIRKYFEGSGTLANIAKSTNAATECGIEVSQTSRATCRLCSQKIVKGEVLVSSKNKGQGARSLAWHHGNCFMDLFPSTQIEKLSGWDKLSAADQVAVRSLAKGKDPSSMESGLKHNGVEGGDTLQEAKFEVGAKRKNASTDAQNLKLAKTKGDVSACGKNNAGVRVERSKAADTESKLEAQTKALWVLKDDLKKYVSTAELREMLEANGQDSSGLELDLRDRCADGMMFGALKNCPMCSRCLRYSGSTYRCHGYLSEWTKCSYSTAQPERHKGKWKIPEYTNNQYILKWFKSQKASKPAQILSPPSSSMSGGNRSASGLPQHSKDEKLGDLKVAMVGLSEGAMKLFKDKIEEAGGQVHPNIKKDTNCLVMGGELSDQDAERRKARGMKIPIVREDYLADCIQRNKKLPFDLYKVEVIGGSSSMATVKVKGRSAVHESSGLQDSGHILEDGTSIYNTTLSMADLSSGINSYYILQIIEDDKGLDCCVFRKWGRVGNDKIGSKKLEKMSRSDAIEEFKRLFLEKTGNSWEAWVHKQGFQKQPSRFYPLDIDYGANKQVSRKNMDPALKELIKMLFNVETYRAAMREFEINLSEMPLGKLSKSNIHKGFEALKELQNLFKNDALDPSMRESKIVDASNRFFTLIPSIHPHVIIDEDDFNSKVKMLEALQDIEIASRLVGFDVDIDDSLDDKYKKLCCEIVPLAHDSEDYRLIETYLLNTHASTHTEWSLELEEVFLLDREGEFDNFAPYREKLGNRMLLWHGSRLTNFVGILSQGLRIAPPEAPVSGYMFGKGIYFADLVSKSAQYCYTDKKSPVGLMLLSEVALGEIYELKEAKYMDKPPKGKHSTKGLGKKVPEESEFRKWRDEVTVPCGRPVDSKVKTSVLLYNEYVVYDTAQVKMQFLLKVRFHHRR